MRRLYIALVLSIALAVAGCASKGAQKEPGAATEAEREAADQEVQGSPQEELERSEKIVLGVEDLVATNNEFAFDLYKAVRDADVAISPHGVASTLSLAHGGASGETAEQLAEVLHAELGEHDLHRKYGQLHEALRQRETPRHSDAARGFRFRVVSGVWHARSVRLEPAFLRIASQRHLAESQSLTFESDPEQARATINRFVSDATAGKIEGVMEPGDLTTATRVVFTNAVYFDAPWSVPFDRAATADATFAAPSGERPVPMMRTTDRFAYLAGDGFQMVELPYADGDVVATVLLPDQDESDFDAGITADYFDWMISQARQTQVEVRLPRFELDERYDLRSVLTGMGVRDAFDSKRADFSRLASTDEPLFVNQVVHQTHIRVDEEGTEAAAATVGGMRPTGATVEVERFVADRPFLFVVRDVPTGAILFIARVSEP